MEYSKSCFDYIVVGGGTTGLVVASRLSEDPHVTVAILEAGSHVRDDDRVDIPGYFGQTIGDPEFDWMLESEPQKHVSNRRLLLPRGRILGGTSALNSMTWARASKQDYDAMRELGNPGWGWDDWLPYMLKSENLHPSSESDVISRANLTTTDPKLHSTEGPVHLSFVPWLGATHQPFFQSLNRLGVPVNLDSGSGHNVGNFTLSTSIDPASSTRSNSTTAYYEPSSQRPNLTLITKCHARRIITSNNGGVVRADGVEVRHNGKVFVVHSRKEVILAAGAYMTPAVLELSGIGDAARLHDLGIDAKVDLPGVGENLQDHLLVPTTYELRNRHETSDLLRNPDFAREELDRYKATRKGQYASIHSAFSLLPVDRFMQHSEIKSIERTYDQLTKTRIPRGIKKQYDIQRRWLTDPSHAQVELMHVPEYLTTGAGQPKPDGRYVSILCVLMHALSRGSVHIHSSDPFHKPRIDPNFLSREADLLMLIQAVRFARRVASTRPLSDMITECVHPSPESVQTDREIADYVRTLLETAHHPVGTASMLPKEDRGVVDPSLKVYSTSNIRIADASILPLHFSAHPQATLYALGEKAADIISRANQTARSRL